MASAFANNRGAALLLENRLDEAEPLLRRAADAGRAEAAGIWRSWSASAGTTRVWNVIGTSRSRIPATAGFYSQFTFLFN